MMRHVQSWADHLYYFLDVDLWFAGRLVGKGAVYCRRDLVKMFLSSMK